MENSSVTIEDINKTIKDLPKNPLSFNNPFNFCGLKVFEEPLPPQKLKLSKHIQVPDKFRIEYNAWLLDMFGRHKSFLERDKCFLLGTMGAIVVPHGMAGIIASTMA